MKIKTILASAIAASLSISAQAANVGTLSDDMARPMRLQKIDSNVVPASCECQATPSCTSCDLSTPLQFSGCNDNSCCDSSNCCDGLGGGGGKGLLGLGIIKPSERCYDDFISPMTNPTYFEDPRQLTEVRDIFINHKVVGAAGGGNVRLYAMQARVRLTDRLSLIAVKDGYIDSSNPIIASGWADIGAGLKYSLYRDACNGRMLSVGARFETTSGSRPSQQANGEGVFDYFLSGGTRLGSRAHYLTTSGFILPIDTNAENQMFYWSNHLDRRFGNMLYGFTELNWYNYMKNGNAFPAIEGGDLFNFGANGVKGHNLVTNAWGLKVKPNRHLESGVAFEFPMSELKGVMQNRLTADLILRY